MTKVVRRPPKIEKPEAPVVKDGIVTRYDFGLYNGTERRPVSVGIDPARAALAVSAYCPEDGTAFLWLIKPKRHWVQGLVELQSTLGMVFDNIKMRTSWLHHVAMENYSYGEEFQLASMGEAGGLIKLLLIRTFGLANKTAYPTLVAPNQLKKFATGSGQSKKNVIMLSVYKKWGVELRDDNLADSYTLARLAAALGTGKTQHAYEREVIERLRMNSEWQALDQSDRTKAPVPSKTSKSRQRAPRRQSSG